MPDDAANSILRGSPEDFAVPTPDDLAAYAEPGVKVFFNPFRFSIELGIEIAAVINDESMAAALGRIGKEVAQ